MTSSWLLPRIVELSATYLVQSTLFLAVGWALLPVLSSTGRRRKTKPDGPECPSYGVSPAITERLWKLAAVLALVTAPMSVFIGWSRPAWEWTLREPALPVNAVVSLETTRPEPAAMIAPFSPTVVGSRPALPEELAALDDNPPSEMPIADEPSADFIPFSSTFNAQDDNFNQRTETEQIGIEQSTVPLTVVESPANSLAISRDSDPVSASHKAVEVEPLHATMHWLGFVLAAWVILSALRLVAKGFALRRRLAGCEPIHGELRHELNRLLPRGRAVRLLRSGPLAPRRETRGQDTITEPFACGLFRWTIVLPAEIERELSPAELKALLAHEVAHLVRRDPRWLWLGEVLCTCLAFQPLNFLARRRWQQAAELLCDDWAVERHVSATSLASCLTRIAERRLDRRAALMGLTAVGLSGSLTHRIEWLLRTGRASEPKRSRGRTLAALLTFSAGLFVGTYGPRLSFVLPADAHDDSEAVAPPNETEPWNGIDHDLVETLNELGRLESQLASDPDPEVASLASRLRARAASLKHRLNR